MKSTDMVCLVSYEVFNGCGCAGEMSMIKSKQVQFGRGS